MPKRLSPGGALLRSSRLFSLPKPLRAPPTEARSPTATTGFPTHQSITTAEASRTRGDWGVKYPLPAKSTAGTTTPLIRVLQVDAPESVTDFKTAADHTLSGEKFTEMNIAMMQPPRFSPQAWLDGTPPQSVFEDGFDFTFLPPDRPRRERVDKRWRFAGPSLSIMGDGEFAQYMDRHVRSPKARRRFLLFLKKSLAAKLAEERAGRRAFHAGLADHGLGSTPDSSASAPPASQAVRRRLPIENITDAQVLEYLRDLRSDFPTLHKLVGDFLDLAPIRPSTNIMSEMGNVFSQNPWADVGLPSTHPSIGLSYLRSSAYLENHPLHGPQASHSPVQARVLLPTRMGTPPKLGLGGFVTEPVPTLSAKSARARTAGMYSFDRSVKGGSKVWLVAETAVAKPNGLVHVYADRASNAAELVQREWQGENVSELRRQSTNYFSNSASSWSSTRAGGGRYQ